MSDDPFHAVFNGVKHAFEEHLTSQHPILLRAVTDVYDRVLEDFGRQVGGRKFATLTERSSGLRSVSSAERRLAESTVHCVKTLQK